MLSIVWVFMYGGTLLNSRGAALATLPLRVMCPFCTAQVLSKALRDCELDFSAVLVQQTNANLPSVSTLTHQAQEQDLAVSRGAGGLYTVYLQAAAIHAE
jgi:hypothetical protein